MKNTSIAWAVALIALGPAAAQPAIVEQSQEGLLAQQIKALKARTLKNLVFVKGGTFKMGDFGQIHSPEGLPYSADTDNKVLHDVRLDSFSLSAYKVTYEDFDVFTDAMGQPRISMHRREVKHRSVPGVPAGVNWYQARDYCQWMGKLLNLPMGLPTEAQWEYAARNRGKFVVYATDNDKVETDRNVISYDGVSEFERKHMLDLPVVTMPVGEFPPTPLGLYDVINNGHEWVQDWYAPVYDTAPQVNPTGPQSGEFKVRRGSDSKGGESLAFNSMTFTRSHSEPVLSSRFSSSSGEIKDSGLNPHKPITARCAVTLKKPVR